MIDCHSDNTELGNPMSSNRLEKTARRKLSINLELEPQGEDQYKLTVRSDLSNTQISKVMEALVPFMPYLGERTNNPPFVLVRDDSMSDETKTAPQ